MEIFSGLVLRNLARGKMAFQVTTYSDTSLAGNAVDGQLETLYPNIHCALTSKLAHPWWALDLGQPSEIAYVTALARSGTFQGETLQGVRLLLEETMVVKILHYPFNLFMKN